MFSMYFYRLYIHTSFSPTTDRQTGNNYLTGCLQLAMCLGGRETQKREEAGTDRERMKERETRGREKESILTVAELASQRPKSLVVRSINLSCRLSILS